LSVNGASRSSHQLSTYVAIDGIDSNMRYKLKCETKNKLMSVIDPIQPHYHEGSPVGNEV